ncbi:MULTISPECIES: 1-deoxy-D-xylulose-5-phosphate synthase [Thermoactinomyces]|uniref:1-deoxy-D-xylulose-5-phosphate synthase n=1 Tax=Thermoactinomyces vulgaris TaxID=2026 RepID=A0ABS0QE71_THEVU|nr:MULTISPECIES: 1-deoxy-D-xylulose-5-phosphate synthase [Thermoactinomyces]MBH8582201.1 1-deoxy-D-xylulose-5-phosphate synthase [Thermoactinomyces sp. CICC 10735]MBI0386181.1 1-deoxy-D-xylulose-5-phosphate synthase [Thermoactinomyces sp. CICC 24227]MBI0390965.1 1-deoxy-D-xylulose-5-phosphate synthase [Thermoactinomyces sp. CICC 24226]KFZ41069.1 1-deoxy-D-xylulose-5-phosphate synthase [Thermoactinomyces sp. Gus2-1]KYQ87750.1 1-deoxy-D-xylulose-5-phosphate synthase [Thermoactinomyces sp. AS95]
MHLEQINSPDELKKLPVEELPKLAEEIRRFLIESLSKTGGHLASNLGVVELTIALHYLFDSPRDKILWDVGHQAYVHKILTGRREMFSTLRQYKGLCGFPKMRESEHDCWETGHSSTSLSGAMGMVAARDLKGEDYKVIPVIGDGALTGGMALEALNHIGESQSDMIVILNDNEMSISPNVGAIHNHLARLRTNKSYNKMKDEIQHLLKKIPTVGVPFAKTLERIKDSLKYLVVSGVFFEHLGFTYIGPVDGHQLDELMESLRLAGKTKGPVLVHVITRKGYGYKPAEDDSVVYHGVGTYKIESGAFQKKAGGPPNYPSVFGKTLVKLAEKDERIVAITPAMLTGSKLEAFQKKFPQRCFDVGIAEQHAVTFAAGLATQGMKPVLAIYSTFLQRGYDQLVHDVCRQNLNVVFAVDRAGFVGEDGETHQGIYDIGYMRSQPNIVIMMPKDENELQHMIHTAVQYNDGPVAVRYSKSAGVGVPMDDELKLLPIGKAEEVRPGKDVAILALGPMVQTSLEAAEQLKEKGIDARVINARFAKPLDTGLLDQLADENIPLITVEEAAVIGGFGSAVLEYYQQKEIEMPKVKILGVPDIYVEHGSIDDQRREVGLTPEGIADTVNRFLSQKIQKA